MGSLFGTRADLIVDLFLVVLVLVLPTVFVAVAAVRRGNVRLHAALMTGSFLLFVLALVAFEINVRFQPDLPAPKTGPFVVHLAFALPTLVLWVIQILRRKQAFTEPAVHRRRGRLLAPLLTATVATGIWLYVATFV